MDKYRIYLEISYGKMIGDRVELVDFTCNTPVGVHKKIEQILKRRNLKLRKVKKSRAGQGHVAADVEDLDLEEVRLDGRKLSIKVRHTAVNPKPRAMEKELRKLR